MEIPYQTRTIRAAECARSSAANHPSKIRILVGRRAELRSESAVTPGTAVRIDLEDSMLLGEVACMRVRRSPFCYSD